MMDGQCGRQRPSPSRLGVRAVLSVIVLASCVSLKTTTDYTYEPSYGVRSPQFLNSLAGLRNGITAGNSVTLLENGDGLFPDLLKAIAAAQRSINIEIYRFEDGKVGGAIATALCERARAGVAVRVLVDGFGSQLALLADTMSQAGVKVRVYKPIRIYSLQRIGHRTHRKIVVVDGRVGYCGGFGFDDRWLGDARNEHEWHDLALRVDGPVARQFERIFMEDWVNTTGEVLHGDDQFPAIAPAGDAKAQAISSSRTDQSSMSKLLFFMAIQAARNRIWIENAYFVPDAQMQRALVRAAKRGVDVRILVPGPTIDIPAVRRASRHHYGELLDGGVKIYEYQPTMLHTKAMTVDGVWPTIGSMNLDARSMRKNAEANLVVYDTSLTAAVEAVVENDLRWSKALSKEAWTKRSFAERAREAFASLFSEMY
jgi:cardiolipin synthase